MSRFLRNFEGSKLRQFLIKKRVYFTGKDYDIRSVMHYGNFDASRSRGLLTMTSIKNPYARLGPDYGRGFSAGDKLMLQRKGRCENEA